jgi:hypothetical protein
MGATSVTGVSGSGSVQDLKYPGGFPQGKGSEHMTLGVTHLVGPRVVSAGLATLAAGTATVQLPDLLYFDSNVSYLAVATDTTGNHSVQAVLTFPSASGVEPAPYLTLTGTGTDVIAWTVVKGNN